MYNIRLALYIRKNSLFLDFQRQHEHNTRNRNFLLPEYQRLTVTQQSLSFIVPNFWNILPTSLKNEQRINVFKRNLQEMYLNCYN